jgi:Ca2+-binding RTX toxin-like protein
VINSHPVNPSISTDAAFTFSGTDDQTLPGALTFECQLDSGGFSACVSPQNYIGLSVGNHTFDVRARDQANNVDATPATYTWEVITGPIATVVNGVCRPALPAASQLNLSLFDPEGDLMTLKLISNTNTILVPNRFIIIRGVGTTRTVTIGAVLNRTGVATITLEVSDGVHSTPIVINFQVGTNGIDTLNGTSGIDVIIGQNGNDTLTGGAGNDLLCGGVGNDTLNGDDGNDILDGSAGNDILNGGADNDILRGFGGIDTLTGGLGADFFSGGIGVDILTDYTVLEGDTKDWLSP